MTSGTNHQGSLLHRIPKPNWFRTWFNSPYYHLLYQNHSDQEANLLINNLVSALRVPFDQPVLDLACGKGRHSRSFNQLGYQVTGLDLSPESIAAAQAMAIEQQAEHLTFAVHDMRIPFATSRYGLVVNLFTSFGYFPHRDENLATLGAISQALLPNGLVVIDYLNPAPILAKLPLTEVISRGEVDFRISKWFDEDFIYKNIDFEVDGHQYQFDEQVQILTHTWFAQAFAEVGISLKHIWGDYQLADFNDQSSRLIVVGQKLA